VKDKGARTNLETKLERRGAVGTASLTRAPFTADVRERRTFDRRTKKNGKRGEERGSRKIVSLRSHKKGRRWMC